MKMKTRGLEWGIAAACALVALSYGNEANAAYKQVSINACDYEVGTDISNISRHVTISMLTLDADRNLVARPAIVTGHGPEDFGCTQSLGGGSRGLLDYELFLGLHDPDDFGSGYVPSFHLFHVENRAGSDIRFTTFSGDDVPSGDIWNFTEWFLGTEPDCVGFCWRGEGWTAGGIIGSEYPDSSIQVDSLRFMVYVPEPGTMALLAFALAGIAVSRRRKLVRL
jgi:hypothetical protein